MPKLKRLMVVLALLLGLAAAWLWWQRPRRADMAAYVPADTLIYLEINDLPALAEAFTQTGAWRLAAQKGALEDNLSITGRLGKLAAWTGLGPAEKVALARSQVAVAALGARLGPDGDALKLKPQYAVVVETHTGAGRAQPAVEERLGAFAAKAYGATRLERREENGANFVTWRANEGERRIVAAFSGSVVIIAPDEEAARACLEVKNGMRPGFNANAGLQEMRGRLAGESLAFGYVPPEGLGQLFKLAATAYAAPFVLNEPQLAGALQSLLPALPPKVTKGLGWNAQLANGGLEDRYFLTLKNGLAEQLREPFATSESNASTPARFAPPDAYSLTRYNLRQPAQAWTGLNKALASQLDIVGAMVASRLLAASFQPFGIEEPAAFLAATGREAATLRLDAETGGTVVVAKINDENALRAFAAKRLGPDARRETIGAAALFTATDEERGAAAFVDGYFLWGPPANVRQCLETYNRQASAAQTRFGAASNAAALTYTNDQATARAFLSLFAKKDAPPQTLTDALRDLPYAASETRLLGDGLEKRSNSAFGLLGAAAAQFAP
jgi:hypothetical protein